MDFNWRSVDNFYSHLKDNALLITFISLATDALYSVFVLASVFDLSFDPLLSEGIHNHVNPVLCFLIISIILNLLVFLYYTDELIFFLLSFLKFLLFTFLIYLQLFIFLSPNAKDFFGDFWLSVLCVLTAYNGLRGVCLFNQFRLHFYIMRQSFRVRKHLKALEQQYRHFLFSRNKGPLTFGLASLPAELANLDPEYGLGSQNPLEKFYVAKTARLHHNYLMRNFLFPEGNNFNDENFEEGDDENCMYYGDTEFPEDSSDVETENDIVANIWTLSDSVEKFMDEDEYQISNVQIRM